MNLHRDAEVGPHGLVTVDLYRYNAFRLSGLPVDATPRHTRRRTSELEAAERLGIEASLPSGILLAETHPGIDAAIEALVRLRDPLQRLWDELFWLWPLPQGGYGGDSLSEARDVWEELSTGPAQDRCVAVHNLAVADHITALEAEPTDGDESTWNWRRVHRRWLEFTNEDECRTWLKSRAEAIGDPRLGGSAVDEALERLPTIVLSTHAAVAMASNNVDASSRHAELMRDSGFEYATVDRVLVEACTSYTEHVRAICERVWDTDERDRGNRAATKVLNASRDEELRVACAMLGADHRVTSGLRDELASCVRECVVAEANRASANDLSDKMDSIRRGIQNLDQAESLAAAPHIRDRICVDNATLSSNLVMAIGDDIMLGVDDDASSGLSGQEALLAETTEHLCRLDELDPYLAGKRRYDVTLMAQQMIVRYVNATGDAASAVEPMRAILPRATDPELRARIKASIQDLEHMRLSQPNIRTVTRPPPRRKSDRVSRDPGVPCVFCGFGTGVTRTFTFYRTDQRVSFVTRDVTVPCCQRCAAGAVRIGRIHALFGLGCPLALVAVSVFGFSAGWGWSQMWIPIFVLAFLTTLAWSSVSRIGRDWNRLGQNRKISDALSDGWKYHSG